VRFRTVHGDWINNIEVTHALRRFPLAQFVLHQRADNSLRFRLPHSWAEDGAIRESLLALFGAGQSIEIEHDGDFGGKVVQYTSALPGAQP
jgi:phenylacetate-CoA ligase